MAKPKHDIKKTGLLRAGFQYQDLVAIKFSSTSIGNQIAMTGYKLKPKIKNSDQSKMS